jgi:hypothetical protein
MAAARKAAATSRFQPSSGSGLLRQACYLLLTLALVGSNSDEALMTMKLPPSSRPVEEGVFVVGRCQVSNN